MTAVASAFTVKSNGGPLHVLKTPCSVSLAFDLATTPHPPRVTFGALWDTGATNSCITQRVVDALGLKPIGMAKVQGVNGISASETYLVGIVLDNGVSYPSIRVTRGNLGPDTDVLIGMDIICTGDFAITNKGGNTIFSFRHPSFGSTDYVEQGKALNARLNPSHGGSGKDRKKKGKGK